LEKNAFLEKIFNPFFKKEKKKMSDQDNQSEASEGEEVKAPKILNKKRKHNKSEPGESNVPILPLSHSPNFGTFGKQSIKVSLLVGDADCVLTLEYVPKDVVLDISKFQLYLFRTANGANDLSNYCQLLHSDLKKSLNTSTLNLRIDASGGENVVLSSSKRMNAKKKVKTSKPKKEIDEDE
jgi:hypothetical protein